MPNTYFEFKQFTIHHDRCAMKVGTDGVLLGAWTPLESLDSSASKNAPISSNKPKRILDVGTGTGLITLQLAQRISTIGLPFEIIALEIDPSAALQASENVARSPWANNISVFCCDFRTFQSACRFHLIVSNPPYFVDALKCPDSQRNTARHTTQLNYDLLFRHSSELLADDGLLCIIIPAEAENLVMDVSWMHRFLPVRRCRVFTKPGKPCRRLLLAFRHNLSTALCRDEELCIQSSTGEYTPEYIALNRDFYLKM